MSGEVNLYAPASYDSSHGTDGILCSELRVLVFLFFDAIFTRIGAADDLVSGQSTFMVEMMEANNAIARCY